MFRMIPLITYIPILYTRNTKTSNFLHSADKKNGLHYAALKYTLHFCRHTEIMPNIMQINQKYTHHGQFNK